MVKVMPTKVGSVPSAWIVYVVAVSARQVMLKYLRAGIGALDGDSLLLRLNDREHGESAANLPDEWPKSAYVRHLRRNSSGISSRFRSVTPVRVSRLAVRIRQGPNGRLKWFA